MARTASRASIPRSRSDPAPVREVPTTIRSRARGPCSTRSCISASTSRRRADAPALGSPRRLAALLVTSRCGGPAPERPATTLHPRAGRFLILGPIPESDDPDRPEVGRDVETVQQRSLPRAIPNQPPRPSSTAASRISIEAIAASISQNRTGQLASSSIRTRSCPAGSTARGTAGVGQREDQHGGPVRHRRLHLNRSRVISQNVDTFSGVSRISSSRPCANLADGARRRRRPRSDRRRWPARVAVRIAGPSADDGSRRGTPRGGA